MSKSFEEIYSLAKKQCLYEEQLMLESPINVIYKEQLSLIKDQDKRQRVENVLRQADVRNISEPASSTGKFHPQFASGKYGLSRHTKAVVAFIADFCKVIPELNQDVMVIAALLHDIVKYKSDGKYTSKTHAIDAAALLEKNGLSEEASLVKTHMGNFEKDSSLHPKTFNEKMLHLADYLASRTYIDIDFDDDDNIIMSNEDSNRTRNKLKKAETDKAVAEYERDFMLGRNEGF